LTAGIAAAGARCLEAAAPFLGAEPFFWDAVEFPFWDAVEFPLWDAVEFPFWDTAEFL
jgi:hypothetical protein